MFFICLCFYLVLIGAAYSDYNYGSGLNCKTTPMLKLTDNRYISYHKQTWENALKCCQERNMILHTPETTPDEGNGTLALALREATDKGLGDNEAPFWVGGNNFGDKPGQFEWFYKSPAGKDAVMYERFMPEKHFWIEDEPTEENYCMAVSATIDGSYYDKLFIGISAKPCSDERYFICQATDLPRWGKDITPADRHYCEKQTIADYKELPEGIYMHYAKQLPWQAANYCCEQLGMTLAGDLVSTHQQKKNEKVMKAIQWFQNNERWHKAKRSIDMVGFWIGLTAFCDKKWTWVCGKPWDVASDKNWYVYRAQPDQALSGDFKQLYIIQTPDNIYGNEFCGEALYRSFTSTFDFLTMNDDDCNIRKYFMCEKIPKCPSEESPFNCNVLESIPPDNKLPEDLIICNNITFEFLGNGSDHEFHISKLETRVSLCGTLEYNLLTWGGYMECLQKLELTPASFESEEEKEFFRSYFYADKDFQQKLIWMPAVAENSKSQFVWASTEPVPSEDILFTNKISFRAPECATLGYSKGKVGLIATSCLARHYMVYKKPFEITQPENETIVIIGPPVVEIGNNNTIIDPFPVSNRTNNGSSPCINKDLVYLLSSVCPNLTTTINRPNSKQIEFNVKGTTEEELHKLRYQNRKLKQTVIDIAMSGTTYYAHNPRNSHRLASLVAGVYVVQCPQVPRSFIEDILHYFHRLHFFTSRGRVEFFGQKEFVWIRKLMQKCVNESKLINFRTDECSEMIIAEESCENFICPDSEYQFNVTRFDPMMEAWWKMYELAHAVCFEFFDESYRMFHLNAKAFMDTWSEALRLRLGHQIQSNKFWERIFGPEYELYLLNMDRCNHAVISQSKLPYRQHISTLPKRVRLHGTKPGSTAENPAPDL